MTTLFVQSSAAPYGGLKDTAAPEGDIPFSVRAWVANFDSLDLLVDHLDLIPADQLRRMPEDGGLVSFEDFGEFEGGVGLVVQDAEDLEGGERVVHQVLGSHSLRLGRRGGLTGPPTALVV